MERKKKAAIYCRISRDSTGKREGVERQYEDCQMMCRLNGYEVYEVYEDNSISAHATATKHGKERPKYEKMLSDFKRGKFDVIVAWKLDRLTRSVSGLEEMLKELASQKLRICTTDLGGSELDLSTADAVMLAQIMASFAQFEASRKGERTRRANLQRAQEGIMRRGSRCFGYDRQNRIIEPEAEVVRAIYDAYRKGSSMGAITRAIAGDDDGTLPDMPTSEAPSVIVARERGKTPPNKKWSLSTTQSILRNPKYAGYAYYAPVDSRGKCRSYNSTWRDYIVRDENGEIVRGTTWEPIVAEDVWWECQERRDSNLSRADGTHIEKKGNQKKHIGAGVYRCGICGGKVKSGATDKRAGYTHTHTYRCDGHVNRMGGKIDEFVCAVVRERLAREDLRDLLCAKADSTPRLKEIQDEIASLQARVKQTEHDYDEDLIDASTRKRKIGKLTSKIMKLEDEREELMPRNASSGIISSPDPAKAFDALTDPAQISRVIDELCTVTLYPHKAGTRVTAESMAEDVKIEWK
ncbi:MULTISPECIES: recombinase family protein [unclassified Collinsella]|uniref:recombinase family protein n=1 Tax=unclassified Collinsella TaxID=2637548 RepID=UPI003F91B488